MTFSHFKCLNSNFSRRLCCWLSFVWLNFIEIEMISSQDGLFLYDNKIHMYIEKRSVQNVYSIVEILKVVKLRSYEQTILWQLKQFPHKLCKIRERVVLFSLKCNSLDWSKTVFSSQEINGRTYKSLIGLIWF